MKPQLHFLPSRRHHKSFLTVPASILKPETFAQTLPRQSVLCLFLLYFWGHCDYTWLSQTVYESSLSESHRMAIFPSPVALISLSHIDMFTGLEIRFGGSLPRTPLIWGLCLVHHLNTSFSYSSFGSCPPALTKTDTCAACLLLLLSVCRKTLIK